MKEDILKGIASPIEPQPRREPRENTMRRERGSDNPQRGAVGCASLLINGEFTSSPALTVPRAAPHDARAPRKDGGAQISGKLAHELQADPSRALRGPALPCSASGARRAR